MTTQQTRLAEEIGRLRDQVKQLEARVTELVEGQALEELGKERDKFREALEKIAEMNPNAGSENQPVFIARSALRNVRPGSVVG